MKGFHLFVVLILSPVVGGWSRSQPSVGERVVHPGCGVLIKGHIIPIIISFLFTALEQKKKNLFKYSERDVKDCSQDFLRNDEYLLDIPSVEQLSALLRSVWGS